MLRINNKNKKIAMVIVAVIGSIWTAFQNNRGTGSDKDVTYNNSNNVIYTKHAKCRMGCRHLNKEEVRDVIANGKINRRKSNPKASPCPVVSKEKRTKDNQFARVVYANCPSKIKIITVIDLDNKYNCHCD